jgi:hypothetical protein
MAAIGNKKHMTSTPRSDKNIWEIQDHLGNTHLGVSLEISRQLETELNFALSYIEVLKKEKEDIITQMSMSPEEWYGGFAKVQKINP